MARPDARDLEDTRDRLTGWLRRRLAGASELEVRGLRAPSDTGFSSDTLLGEVVRKEDGEEVRQGIVVRIQPRGFDVFPTYDLTVQWRVMDALAATDVPVPRMLWHDWSDATLGAPFYVMERLEGWVPSDTPPMHVAGKVAEELSPGERSALWWSGLEAMTRVHRVDPQALGLDFLAEPERGATPLEQHLRYWEAYLDWGLDEPSRYTLVRRALDWLARERPPEHEVRLCWGDARLANQIFAGTDCVGVLDWEMARLGDPELDLGWWIGMDRCFSEGLDVARLAGMPGREETVARWEARVGRAARHLDYYEAFALMRFSAIMARLGLQMRHYGLLPADSDFPLRNLASVTLERKLAELGV